MFRLNRRWVLLMIFWGILLVTPPIVSWLGSTSLPGIRHTTANQEAFWLTFWSTAAAGATVTGIIGPVLGILSWLWRQDAARERREAVAHQQLATAKTQVKSLLARPKLARPSTPQALLPPQLPEAAAVLRALPIDEIRPFAKDRSLDMAAYHRANFFSQMEAFLAAYTAWESAVLRAEYDLRRVIQAHDRYPTPGAEAAAARQPIRTGAKVTYSLAILLGLEPDDILEALDLTPDLVPVLTPYERLLKDACQLQSARDTLVAAHHGLEKAAISMQVMS